jgi:hypothetical protein
MAIDPTLLSLIALASATVGCASASLPAWHHEHRTFRPDANDAAESADPSVLLRRSFSLPGGFSEAILSFNATLPESAGVVAELRVLTREGEMSPWLRLADWGLVPASWPRETSALGIRVAIDELRSEDLLTQGEVRVVAFEDGAASGKPGKLALERLDLILSRVEPDETDALFSPSTGDEIQLELRFYGSEVSGDPELAERVCSPTSLAMLIDQRGVAPDYREVIETVYDPVNGIYGVWPRAIQAARVFGVPGHLQRFSSWAELRRHLEEVGPIAASITAPKGSLSGAPYPSTEGHLLVISGLTAEGDPIVLDPVDPQGGVERRVYSAAEFEEVWLRRKRGTAYVLLPAGAD